MKKTPKSPTTERGASKSPKSSQAVQPTSAAKAPKPIVITLENGKTLTLKGFTSPSGQQFCRIAGAGKRAYIPYRDFTGSGKAGFDRLAGSGIYIIGSTAVVRNAIARIEHFPPRELIERPGWTGATFALPSGHAIGRKDVAKPTILFTPDQGICSTGGSLEAWRNGVAQPLAGQPIASFFLMAGFAPALLQWADLTYNPGFELSGGAGTGKTTLQQIVASIAGPGIEGAAGRYWVTCNATANGMEAIMARYPDMPIIMEEAALFAAGGTASSRATAVTELVFKLASGNPKARYGDGTRVGTRFAYVMTTNQPLAALLGGRSPELAQALSDRLMTIPLAGDRPYGTFDHLPDEYRSGSDFAAALTAVVRENYGVALPAYLQHLVTTYGCNWNRLSAYIADGRQAFLARVGVDPNDGSAVRVASAFSLVYVAGCLARRAGVLPLAFDCYAAAKVCYDLHRTQGRAIASPRERLIALSQRSDVIDLRKDEAGLFDDASLTAAPGFLHLGRKAQLEFLMTPGQLARAFPDWSNIRSDLGMIALLSGDKGRAQRKRVLPGSNDKVWVYCFILP